MDTVDLFSSQWLAEQPGINVEAIAIWGRLKRITSLFESRLAQILDAHDLNLSEFEILAALVRSGSPYQLRPTELTNSLIITAGAVTARINALERRGFISRRGDEQDGRVQLVCLSAQGLFVFKPAFEAVLSESNAMIGQLKTDDRLQLVSSLRAFLGVLDASSRETTPAAAVSVTA
ncbi:MarR family winged helix-turn-helix transcriptional regulator [Achromobacter aloeverae]